jgi:hypothetical protein
MIDLKRDFAHRGLQIVVKLANIELTPEKPTYEGGVWHVEGQLVSSPKPDLSFRPTQTQTLTVVSSHISLLIVSIKLTVHRMSIFVLPPYTTSPTPI